MRKVRCGIYYIKNIVNNKYYVGQSVNIYKRWAEEKLALNNIYDAWNVHLQRAWHKYGEDNFEFVIIEDCTPSQLDDLERYWISFYDSYNNGYNQTCGGVGGCIYTEEERRRRSELWTPEKREKNRQYSLDVWSDLDRLQNARNLQTQRWKDPNIRARMSGINNHNSKGIIQIETGKYYFSITEASNQIGVSSSLICRACKNSGLTAGGYHWRYAAKEEVAEYLNEMGVAG